MKMALSKRIIAMISTICMAVCFVPVIGGSVAFAADAPAVTGVINSSEQCAEVGSMRDADSVDNVGGMEDAFL